MIFNGQSYSQKPACIITINGVAALFTNVTVSSKNYYLSDTYEITLPLNKNGIFTLEYWGSIQNAEVKIYMGFQVNIDVFNIDDLNLIFTGAIDTIRMNVIEQIVTISGRDYSYLLIDKKTTKTYLNKTASEIAIEFAQDNGLNSEVVPTTSPVGSYFNPFTLYSQTNINLTQWDYLTYLAQQINYNVYVKNKTLYFVPKPGPNTPFFEIPLQTANDFSLFPMAPGTSFNFYRTLTLAEDVLVKVNSASIFTGSSFTVSATSHHIKDAVKAPKQTYVFSFPNLTEQEARNIAQAQLEAITHHEIVLEGVMPPHFDLNKNIPILISGTNSNLDQLYYVDLLNISLSYLPPKFEMSFNAKNHDVNTEVSIK